MITTERAAMEGRRTRLKYEIAWKTHAVWNKKAVLKGART
jgi:hypothetical protein